MSHRYFRQPILELAFSAGECGLELGDCCKIQEQLSDNCSTLFILLLIQMRAMGLLSWPIPRHVLSDLGN
jgi:hypothetical protein